MKYKFSSKADPTLLDIDLSIIVVCYNNSNFTKSLIQDLIKLPKNCEVLVVDNNSSDDTESMMQGFIDKQNSEKALITYYRCDENLWHSGGCNTGFYYSQGKNVLFLNNDVRIKINHESWHIKLLENLKDGTLFGPTFGYLRDDFSFIKESNKYENLSYAYLSGWCLAGTRQTFNKLTPTAKQMEEVFCFGPWTESLFYFNDCDLALRAKEQGITLEHIELPLVHLGKMTVKKYHDVGKLYLEGKEKFTKIWGK